MIKKIRLGDIATTITKGTTPTTVGFPFVDTGINFVKIESISENGVFLPDRFAHITDECNRRLGRSRLEENDILFSIAGAIGRTAIVPKSILPANTNQALAIIRIPPDAINLEFVLYALQSQTVKEQSEKQKQGVAQLNLSLKNIADIQIPLVSSEKQAEIVNNLTAVDAIIVQRREQLRLIDQLVKSRFVELFGDPIFNEMDWKRVPLSDCIASIDNGKSFVCDSAARQGDWPAVLKLSAVTYGAYRPEENKAMQDDKQFVENAAVQVGDLLFTRKNTPELVGMCAYVYDTPSKLMMPDLIFRLNTTKKCNKIFLWKLINHDLFRECIQAIATGSAKSMSNISKERLLNLKIILPPIELQEQFAAFVEQVDKSKLAVQKSLDELETLKKSLMQQYFG